MAESGKAGKSKITGQEAESLASAVAVSAVWSERKKSKGESLEDRVARVLSVWGDGSELLKKERAEAFLAAVPKGASWRENFGSQGRRRGRVAMENVLDALTVHYQDTRSLELGLLALLRCGALEKAPGAVIDAVFSKCKDAVESDISNPGLLAREFLRHPAYLGRSDKAPKKSSDTFTDLFDQWLYNAVEGDTPKEREGAQRALEELVSAAEEIPGLREFGAQKGDALRALGGCDSTRCEAKAVELNAWLQQKAREWIRKGVDWPEPGEMAAALCEGLDTASYFSQTAAAEVVATLKVALDCGMGVRRGGDEDQPLALLADISSGVVEGGFIGQAAQLLLDAGASEMDLVEGVEERLKTASRQDVVDRVRAKMEARQLSDSLDAMSREEIDLVREFRRAKREGIEAPARRRPGL